MCRPDAHETTRTDPGLTNFTLSTLRDDRRDVDLGMLAWVVEATDSLNKQTKGQIRPITISISSTYEVRSTMYVPRRDPDLVA